MSLVNGHKTSGKEAQAFNLNPVRGGQFNQHNSPNEVASGYDVFSLPPDLVPSRRQLAEIWFTFNMVANFLRMPALFATCEERLRNGIRWTEVLSMAYPEDASLSCLLYYLKARLSNDKAGYLQEVRSEALHKIKKSRYWRLRDRQFNISAFLDRVVPYVDPKYVEVEEFP